MGIAEVASAVDEIPLWTGVRRACPSGCEEDLVLDPTANVPVDLGNDVFCIDTRMSGYDGITSAYLIRSERPCLVETGTASSGSVLTTCPRSWSRTFTSTMRAGPGMSRACIPKPESWSTNAAPDIWWTRSD